LSYILIHPTVAKFKEKRSEFIAYAKILNSADKLNIYLKELKSLHPTARHFCWAYRIANNNSIIENSSDAGEPSGSAGVPILNAIKCENIINCGIIVVRFFGGVKLGKPGLIRAYRFAAEQAIAKSDTIKWIPKVKILLNGDIRFYGNVLNTVKRYGGKILSDVSTEQINVVIELQLKKFKDFEIAYNEITQNSGLIKKQSEHDQTKEVRK